MVVPLNPSATEPEPGHQVAGVAPGQILLGKYRIERVLGMGGMGVVVAATHVTLEQRVAIKFLLPHALSNGEAVARFLREARAAVRIKSEHVARVTDVGQLENGAPYMIMEYLEGADLGSIGQRHGALPLDDGVEFVLQACEAIAEAHALGIVHRDLKPANLFLVTRRDGTPSVKVLDFGISKVSGMSASGADLGMTKTSTVMGSPLYMSPEQMASSRDVDARTDIWALGAILYELLTGTVPFQADTITQLCVMILQNPTPALRNLRPDAPEGLGLVIARCLEKDRNRRYATIADFAQALAPYAPRRARLSVERVARVIESAGLGGSRPSVDESIPPSSYVGAGTGAAWGTSSIAKRGGGRAVGLAAAGLLLLGGAVGVGIFLLRGHRAETPASTAEAKPAPAATLTSTPARTAEAAIVAPAASVVASAAASVAAARRPAPVNDAATPAAAATGKAVPTPKARARSSAKSSPAVAPAPSPTSAAVPAPAKPANKVNLYDDRK